MAPWPARCFGHYPHYPGAAVLSRKPRVIRNVIEAAKSAGATKIVYTSVQGAEEAVDMSGFRIMSGSVNPSSPAASPQSPVIVW